jgi:hypothetical protein
MTRLNGRSIRRVCVGWSSALVVGALITNAPLRAQVGPLTVDTLRAMLAPDWTPGSTELEDVLLWRMENLTADMWGVRELDSRPFRIGISTPRTRAAAIIGDARRRFRDPPPMALETLNAMGLIVDVGPGRNVVRADSIETVVIQHAITRAIVKPSRATRLVMRISNAFGVSKTVTAGSFHFPYEALHGGPVRIVCVGKTENYEWLLTADVLARLR